MTGRPLAPRAARRVRPSPRFYSLASKVERTLVQALVALGLVVVLSQLFLRLPATRYVMSYVDRLEGVSLETEGASVTVALARGGPASSAYLLVNGERIAAFVTGKVRLAVKGDELLEVDGTRLDGEAVFFIVETDGGVKLPFPGAKVTTRKSVGSFGRVEFETAPGTTPDIAPGTTPTTAPTPPGGG